MASKSNPFCWYELVTSDAAAAARFYGDLFGWEPRDAGNPEVPYTLLSKDGRDLGGIFQIPAGKEGAAMEPGWNGYIAGDVDADIQKVVAAGGTVHVPPMVIPDVGRFAVVADPQGAVFTIFTPLDADAPPPEPVPAGAAGHVGWHELHAGDGATVFDFYADLFGWQKSEALDMGPSGVYQIFAINGVDSGGIMTRMPDMPAPCWLYYVNVEALDAAIARANTGGGKILLGPHQVPGDSWIAVGMDPQGAMFAMVSTAR